MAVGYKLADDYNRAGPVKFAGIPGAYVKGEARSVVELRTTEKEMDDKIKSSGVPLVKVKNVSAGEPIGPEDLATTPDDDKGKGK